MELPMYNGKRIAVVLNRGGVQRVLGGLAVLENDECLGSVVRIRLQEKGSDLAGRPEILLQEDTPAECMAVDDRYGCDFCLDLGVC